DGRAWRRPVQRFDHRRKMPCSAVLEVVAIDRRNDDVAEAQLADRFGDVGRLVRIESTWLSRGDVAEGAGACADVTHDHEGGVLVLPALADVGARRLLADGGETVLTHHLPGLG